MEMGADDYITKPFDDLELLRAIEIRLRKMDIIHAQYAPGEKGANELMKDLQGSGWLPVDPNQFDSEQLPKKHFLYNEGKRPKFMYYIISGKVKTFKAHGDGKEYITDLYSTGDYLGYVALLQDTNYDDTAEILEDAEVVKIPKDDFLKSIYNDMNIATKFIKLVTSNVKEKEERMLGLAYDSLRKRVAKALVDIHQKFNKDSTVSAPIDIPREGIAQYVGTATESLIRTLSDFKSEKLIEIKEGKIRILSVDKLNNLLY
jgi:CRP-like cAMP-binding protein